MIAEQKMPVLVWKEGDVFVADCPLVQIASQGLSESEALSNLAEAIELYFEDVPFPEFPAIENAHCREVVIPVAS